LTGFDPFGRGRRRRLFGLDRSGPEPTATRKGQPLRPFTIPNFVGLLRLAGIPVFLVLAFESGDGVSLVAAAVFWAIAAGDYLDGLLARVTGQYSRLGALLDPVVDRLVIVSGIVVCWHFVLLPRTLLALLVIREIGTLFLARWAIARGIDLEVNWIGRMAVFPVMSALLFALVIPGWFPDSLLVIGLIMAWGATFLYVKDGRSRMRELERRDQPSSEG
jgi:CDP-diacylglycerol--glycerol-3-phosphate 3-phosphatidyltransferase